MKFPRWEILVTIVGVVSVVRGELLTVSAVSAVVLSGVYYYNSYYCKHNECCDETYVNRTQNSLNVLKNDIDNNLYGQPFASEIIPILQGFNNRMSHKKALSLSFHGWPGTGKNYITTMIANALYQKGMESGYVKLFIGRYDFPTEVNVHTSQFILLNKIKAIVKKCPKALIIFDEVNDYVPGLLDIIKPLMDYHEKIDSIDFREVIFIFLSNTKSGEIADRYLKLNKPRSELKFSDFEDILRVGSFEDESSGFSKSSLIFHQLIDYYIPFLPLEQSHVRKCTIKEFRNIGLNPTAEMVEDVMSVISYGPSDNPIFANAGCKRIRNQVFYVARKSLQ